MQQMNEPQTMTQDERDAKFLQWQPLACRIASKLWQQPWVRRLGSFTDVKQEAFVGLMKAIDGFNPEKAGAATFMTYAYRCIERHIERRAQSSGVVRFPIQRQIDGELPPKIRQLPDEFDQIVPELLREDREDVEIVRAVRFIVDSMKDPYRKILVLRWGLNGKGEESPKQVAFLLRMSVQQVNHFEKIAMRQVLTHIQRLQTPTADRPQPNSFFADAIYVPSHNCLAKRQRPTIKRDAQPRLFDEGVKNESGVPA